MNKSNMGKIIAIGAIILAFIGGIIALIIWVSTSTPTTTSISNKPTPADKGGGPGGGHDDGPGGGHDGSPGSDDTKADQTCCFQYATANKKKFGATSFNDIPTGCINSKKSDNVWFNTNQNPSAVKQNGWEVVTPSMANCNSKSGSPKTADQDCCKRYSNIHNKNFGATSFNDIPTGCINSINNNNVWFNTNQNPSAVKQNGWEVVSPGMANCNS